MAELPKNERDPRSAPRTGDVIRKWEQNFLINDVVMGCVYTSPPLTAHRDWVGIQYFKEWAKTAEVVFVEKAA